MFNRISKYYDNDPDDDSLENDFERIAAAWADVDYMLDRLRKAYEEYVKRQQDI